MFERKRKDLPKSGMFPLEKMLDEVRIIEKSCEYWAVHLMLGGTGTFQFGVRYLSDGVSVENVLPRSGMQRPLLLWPPAPKSAAG